MNEILELKNLSKYYKRKLIFSNVNASFEQGKVTAILGLNGVGKTTLLKVITKQINSSGGSVNFNGNNISDNNLLTDVAYIPDKFILPLHLNANQISKLFVERNPNFDSDYFFKTLNSLNVDSECKTSNMSKGNKEMLQIVLIFSNKPKFLILDEPFSSIDVVKRDFLMNSIIDLQLSNVGIILTTHLINEIENLINDVYILNNNTLSQVTDLEKIKEAGHINITDYLIKNSGGIK